MKRLVPHALIAIGLVAAARGWPEEIALLLFFGGHLLAPIWAARHARPGRSARAFVGGPGLVIATHALLIAVLFVLMTLGNPEDTWLNLMMLAVWAAVIAGYTIYCVIAFAIASRVTSR